jgi:hypothetical protein
MKLETLYRKAVETGIARDRRGAEAIQRLLQEERERYDALPEKRKTWYDRERLSNPFPDSRILNGDPETDVRSVIAGIDIQVGEILLADRLCKESGRSIDLILSHHPQGYALAQLADVMPLQADLLSLHGLNISVAEKMLEQRIREVERGVLPVNHDRAVSAARLLGFPMICLHTPADNCVARELTERFEREAPRRLKDVLGILFEIPEYQNAARIQAGPRIINGSEDNRCGKIYVDMTGGTSGSEEAYAKLADTGTGTVVGMHMNEKHLESAKNARLNVVIAGHISSDTLGLNLLLDEVEKTEQFEYIEISGFERIRR